MLSSFGSKNHEILCTYKHELRTTYLLRSSDIVVHWRGTFVVKIYWRQEFVYIKNPKDFKIFKKNIEKKIQLEKRGEAEKIWEV